MDVTRLVSLMKGSMHTARTWDQIRLDRVLYDRTKCGFLFSSLQSTGTTTGEHLPRLYLSMQLGWAFSLNPRPSNLNT